MQVPDLDFTLDEEIDQTGKKPVERLDDAVIFAEYMGSDDHQDEVEPVSEDESATARETERVVEVEARTEEPAMVVEEEETVDEEPPEPAPIYVPIETPTRSHDERPQVARPVPSWYAAAKEKAAKDLEKKARSGTTSLPYSRIARVSPTHQPPRKAPAYRSRKRSLRPRRPSRSEPRSSKP